MSILAIAALAGGLSSLAPVNDASWSSVRAVGGADLGKAYIDAGQWYLPTGINMAGKPGVTGMNSGIVCTAIKTSHSQTTIYVTAVTSVAMGQAQASCPAAKLGKIKTGTYSVVYRGPTEPDQLLGQVTLGD